MTPPKPKGVKRKGDWTDLVIAGEKLRGQFIGSIRNNNVFKVNKGQHHIIYTYHNDMCKDIICDVNDEHGFRRNIAKIKFLGHYFDSETEDNASVYLSRIYEPLTPYWREAWRWRMELKAARERAIRYIIASPEDLTELGSELNYETISQLPEDFPPSLRRSLEVIADTAFYYGRQYTFDVFGKRNLGIGSWGQLILTDPIINAETMLMQDWLKRRCSLAN